jgi:hypothetical protein
MSTTPSKQEGTTLLIDSIEDAGETSLEVVRKFLDTVDRVFPDLGDDVSRRKIIDSAFAMTEQLVGTATRLAKNILDMTEKTMCEAGQKTTGS